MKEQNEKPYEPVEQLEESDLSLLRQIKSQIIKDDHPIHILITKFCYYFCKYYDSAVL